LILSNVQLYSEVRIDKVEHPLLKVCSNQIFDIDFRQLLLVNFIFETNLCLWICDLDEVSLNWQWLSFHSQILLFIEDWFHCDKFWSILKLHELILNCSHLFLKRLHGQNIFLDIMSLGSHHAMNWFKIRWIWLYSNIVKAETFLIIFQSFFLKNCADPLN